MSRLLLTLAVAATIGLGVLSTRIEAVSPDEPKQKAETPPKQAESKPLKLLSRQEAMAMKLKNSQALLEGIVLNDFQKILKAGETLVAICDLTDFLSAFKGPEYQFHVKIFRLPSETIVRKARDRNMDGVMVAYNDLTLSCVKCHQAMRDKTFAQIPARPDTVTATK